MAVKAETIYYAVGAAILVAIVYTVVKPKAAASPSNRYMPRPGNGATNTQGFDTSGLLKGFGTLANMLGGFNGGGGDGGNPGWDPNLPSWNNTNAPVYQETTGDYNPYYNVPVIPATTASTPDSSYFANCTNCW